MNNSLVTHLKAYAKAVFTDIAYAYTKPSDWKRDYSRLCHELDAHGHRVVTLELPALAKHFDRCLAEELYIPSGLAYGRCSPGRKTPSFLGNLYRQIFCDDGGLRSSPNVDAIVTLRLLLGGLKKLRLPCSHKRTRDAVKDFIKIEAQIPSFTLNWDGDELWSYEKQESPLREDLRFSAHLSSIDPNIDHRQDGRPGSYLDPVFRNRLEILHRVCDVVASSFGDLAIELPEELPKHGPGVVSNLVRGSSKYDFPNWSHKLNATFPQDLYSYPSLGLAYDPAFMVERDSYEHPSKLIAVPKTLKTPRLIACEPVEHQWIQQLVRNQLEGRLRYGPLAKCVQFASQEANQTKAVEGSVDGRYATVDLSSASDRLSCWTVERAFRSNPSILRRLHAARTRNLRNAVDPKLEQHIKLKKFAAQGSAVTFPVQSIVYACVAIASAHPIGHAVNEGSIRRVANQVQVFGDDIIVPTSCLGDLVALIEYLGLVVNRDKTFGTGNFRESCGVDAWRGYNVTPCYLSTPPSTRMSPSEQQSYLDLSNQYHSKGYWRTAEWAASLIPRRIRALLPVVSADSGLTGLTSFVGGELPATLGYRWNYDLHQAEVKTFSLVSKVKTLDESGQNALFQYFTERPEPTTKWKSGLRSQPSSYWRMGWVPTHMILEKNLRT